MVQEMIKNGDQYWYVFLEGLGGTLSLAAITVFFGMIFGAVLAIIKLSKSKIVQFISTAYIEIIRGTPLLLQLYFFWLFLPKYLPFEISDWTCIVIALVINSSAYVAEIIRAGIQAVDKGQMEAAKSLGMSDVHMMTRIIFPQAVKNILPALGNEFIMMVKETSLASVFFINDLMTSYQMIKSATFKPIAPLMITAVIYFIVTFSLSKVVKAMEGRLSVSD
ncbi:MAG: amino acid ABC transporter permease [Turicibacter sanguinis]